MARSKSAPSLPGFDRYHNLDEDFSARAGIFPKAQQMLDNFWPQTDNPSVFRRIVAVFLVAYKIYKLHHAFLI
jgi:hypothetical protein